MDESNNEAQRYICIHGHFYQPPRENPWLGTVEVQDSAFPYHDWNERISAECYEPNAYAHILNEKGYIERISNNYSRISFNFGPTLLSWLQSRAPRVYAAILRADRESRERYSGHGSAMAQAYNHVIMPLASSRDKQTQVHWGVRDFHSRFGRLPEGMWLPETAVDLASLEALAEHGIRYTVLAPHQARAVRRLGSMQWHDVSGGRIDLRVGYRVHLPSGRYLDVLFYDGPISRAVAFERLLNRGEDLAQRLLGTFPRGAEGPQLVHIATDGETYGHHHTYGEMALAYALDLLDRSPQARLTNYGEFLERHPPQSEVQIFENTAWSCAHGIGRWRADCGCNSGGQPGWNQAWRAPLRQALDHLRDGFAPLFEQRAAALLKDPWAARQDYIDIILDGSEEARGRFLSAHAHAGAALPAADQATVWKLLELQRHTQLMYTSCGWFFDDISGLEATQNIRYAARALQLGRQVLEPHAANALESQFLELLAHAKSNVAEYRDGQKLYERQVRPSIVDLHMVGANYALTSLFRSYGEHAGIHCYEIARHEYVVRQAGRVKLCLGRARLQNQITRDFAEVSFAALHLGDHNLIGGVRTLAEPPAGEAEHQRLGEELSQLFLRADLPELMRALDRYYAPGIYSLKQLFRDEQRSILGQILATTLNEAEAEYQQMYENHAPLLRFLAHLGVPRPPALQAAAQQSLSYSLRSALRAEPLELAQIPHLLDEAELAGVQLDRQALGHLLRDALQRLGSALRSYPDELATLTQLEAAIRLAQSPPFQVNLWQTQNAYYELLQTEYPQKLARAKAIASDAAAASEGQQLHKWLGLFTTLGELLKVRVPELS